jgi:glycosyltransferase involved in cell wall biosynthesis
MLILHVIRSLNPASGGPTDSAHMFAAAHHVAGNHVEIATLDAPEEGWTQVAGAQVHPLGPGKGNYGFSLRLLDWLKVNRYRFDGVIVNGLWQYHGVAAREAFAGRRPYVVFSHGMMDPYFNRRYPLKYLKKLVYWTAQEHRTLNGAEAVCFTSEEEKRIAGGGFPFRKFRGVVVPYGTMGPPEGSRSLRQEAFLSAFPALRDQRYLLYLIRIHPKKGCDLLLEGFARAADKEMHLVIAGPDPENWGQALRAQAERLGIAERVHWTGMIRGDVKWGAFYGADAFVLPSHQENFGIAVADALACGVIPLVSDKVNIAPDVVADGAGLMEADTVEGTARLIERLQAMTADQRLAMQQAAVECYQERYALRNSAQEVYRALGLVAG